MIVNNSERDVLKLRKKKQNKRDDLDISLTSNISFYENLSDNLKWDIIFLINSGYEKHQIIKLYLYLNPNDVNQATEYLSQVNGIYQHIFYPSQLDKNICDICGKKNNLHLKNPNFTNKNSSMNSISSIKIYRNDHEIIHIKSKKKSNLICKICDCEVEDINQKNICKSCDSYFCDECLYEDIKENIKNGKSDLGCPNCKESYDEEMIEQILLYNNDNEEISMLKKLIKKNNLKKLILSNPNLMFCPIVNCEGYVDKKNNKNGYNICNKGHKLCISCGEFWHKNGKCPKTEDLDKLFEQFSTRLNLKNCPSCNIKTMKREGCNHITCTYCKKEWCWLCREIFSNTEEHYNNPNKKCYKKMLNGVETIICPKCGEATDSFVTFSRCGHLICNLCFENYIIEENNLKYNVKCFVNDCNETSRFNNDFYFQFIKYGNNDYLKDNYKKFIFLHEWSYLSVRYELRFNNYKDYIELMVNLLEIIARCFDNCISYDCPGRNALEIIRVIFLVFFVVVYILVVPIFFHIGIRKTYFSFFEPVKFYNIFLYLILIIAEELFSITYFLVFIYAHYIYSIRFWICVLIKYLFC